MITTHPLSSEDLLRMWERVEARASTQARALSVLSIAYPEESWESLSAMSIGRRDGYLLALRERLIGSGLALSGACPKCGQEVELVLSTHDLRTATENMPSIDESPAGSHRLEHDGMAVDFRLPNSADLEAAGLCADVESARQRLLDLCVLAVSGAEGAMEIPGSALPAPVQQRLEQEMDQLDPLAVVHIDLECPDCSSRWQARVDVSDFVLTDIGVEAQFLLRDVSTLARLYHWSEQSILSMSPRRRNAYLELAES